MFVRIEFVPYRIRSNDNEYLITGFIEDTNRFSTEAEIGLYFTQYGHAREFQEEVCSPLCPAKPSETQNKLIEVSDTYKKILVCRPLPEKERFCAHLVWALGLKE